MEYIASRVQWGEGKHYYFVILSFKKKMRKGVKKKLRNKRFILVGLALLLVCSINVVSALDVDIVPDSLNVNSNRKYITVYLELPDGDLNDIDVNTLVLRTNAGQRIHVDMNAPTEIGDYDKDGVPDLMVKFLIEYSLSDLFFTGDYVTLTVYAYLVNGDRILGQDIVRIFGK